jgi:5'-nucleotidase (lipoprotein e(P4) family)
MKKVFLFFIVTVFCKLLPAQDSSICKQQEIILKELPVLWQQQAAEYRALCYQAFNIAALRVNEIPKNELRKHHLAIITDLDETILDNSYSEAQLIKDGQEHSYKSWKEWTSRSAATGVPGAVQFLQMAKQKGISVFYISNRDTGDVASTLINLKKLQLPNADTAHMLFLTNSSSKEIRRQVVMSKYKVVMLLGDNLNDFMQVFEGENCSDRLVETDNMKEQWSKKFIVLPNATYGEWENALYDYDRKLNSAQKEAKRRAKLNGYK